MHPRDTTAMDGGSADHAGASIGPPIDGHVPFLRIRASTGYRPSVGIKKGQRVLPYKVAAL